MKWIIGLLLRLGLRTVATFALLLIIAWAIAGGFERMVRGLDLLLVLTVGVAALATGWALARSPLSGLIATLLAGIFGAEFLVVRVGGLGGRIGAVLAASVDLVWRVASWLFHAQWLLGRQASERQIPQPEQLLKSVTDLWNAIAVLLSRTSNWITGIAQGRGAFDPAAVALVWCALIWIVVVWMAWGVRRRERPFEAVLPALVLFAGMIGYTGQGTEFLFPVLGCTLLLMALVGHTARERRWQRTGIGFSEELRVDIAFVTVPVTVALVFLAALFPSVSIRDIAQSVQRVMRDETGEAARVPASFGVAPAPLPTTVFESVRAPGLPNERLIGHSPELSKQVVMRIKTDDVRPSAPYGQPGYRPPPRYYWRSSTYDQYSGRGWYTGWTEIVDLQANQAAGDAKGFAAHLVHQQVEFVQPAPGPLYAVGQLISADHNYRVARRAPQDIFSANILASTYRADSWIVTPTDKQLESIRPDYPDWVVKNYLDLPSDVPPRVLGLARDLTAAEGTPYAQARAIESYLRTFPYTLDVPMPPSGRDVADYFLFDLKRGYCDYYATAMVVLARAVGLPARLVTGYATGDYDPLKAQFTVTQADAHAWVEIYFADYGWVEFEPTAGRAAIDREQESSRSYAGNSGSGAPATAPVLFSNRNNWVVWLAALFALALGGTGVLALDDWRLRRMKPAQTVRAIYRRMMGQARGLRVDTRAAYTPFQMNTVIASRLDDLVRPPRSSTPGTTARANAARQAKYHLRRLSELYVETLYSPYQPDAMAQAKLIQSWGQLRGLLWRARWWQLFEKRPGQSRRRG